MTIEVQRLLFPVPTLFLFFPMADILAVRELNGRHRRTIGMVKVPDSVLFSFTKLAATRDCTI